MCVCPVQQYTKIDYDVVSDKINRSHLSWNFLFFSMKNYPSYPTYITLIIITHIRQTFDSCNLAIINGRQQLWQIILYCTKCAHEHWTVCCNINCRIQILLVTWLSIYYEFQSKLVESQIITLLWLNSSHCKIHVKSNNRCGQKRASSTW